MPHILCFNLTIGKPSGLKKVYNTILNIAEGFNRIEVNILSEQPKKTLSDSLMYESVKFELFNFPNEAEELEDYLKGRS